MLKFCGTRAAILDGHASLFVDEIEKLRRRASIGERTMVVYEFNIVELAQVAMAVRFVTGITPPHPGACAELWKPEPSLQPLVLRGDEPVIKIYVMRDKDAVAHELHERLSNFCEDRRITHHVI